MPPLKTDNLSGKEYWRSLNDLADTPEFREFVDREFTNNASEFLNSNRRRFLKIMGASFALAGLAGCRWPMETLAPYAHRPANRDPGTPVQYTTAMELGGVAQGMLVTSVDGRPIKVDGNPKHVLNRGGSDAYGQASVLNVYDPDRSRSVMQRDAQGKAADSNWATFEAFWKEQLAGFKKTGGKGLAVLSSNSASPSLADMRKRMAHALPASQWFEYDSISDDAGREGLRMVFAQPGRAVPDLSAAQVIVSFDQDFFVGDPLAVKFARDFAKGRQLTNPENGQSATSMNRLYVVESTFTMTGSMAENARHRIPVPAKDVPAVACLLAAELKKQGLVLGVEIPTPGNVNIGTGDKTLEVMAADLLANKGRCVLVAGANQPPELHGLIAGINDALGNTGRTVTYYPVMNPDRPTHLASMEALAAAIRKKEISALVILGGNPVYTAPADLDFAKLLAAVPLTVHLADYVDETSDLCTWHLPESHYLENWGDARTFDMSVSIVQPLIQPIFGGRSAVEVMALVIQDPLQKAYDIVQRTLGIKSTDWRWKKALFDGYVEKTAWQPLHLNFSAGNLNGALAQLIAKNAKVKLDHQHLEVVFRTDSKVFDGRFANNGWLQELPDPMTRLTWDNAALINPKTGVAMGLNRHESQIIRLKVGGRELDIATYMMPGQPENSISIALGYGRTHSGNVGNGAGFNAGALRTTHAMTMLSGVAMEVTQKPYQLATTQDHFVISTIGERAIAARVPDLIHQGTFAEFRKDPGMGHKKTTAVSLWDEHHYDTGYQWGMAVDLTTCVGCSSCVIACQAENNIPIVGKEQVLKGREMQWLRIDRYFRGPESENPQAVHEPILCMQCENAPCEAVCPVGATSHSADGLNMMTYNRCIGTRYCANNCPYKVRRFNFFDYNSGTLNNLYTPNILRSEMNPLIALQKNPQVSIRVRGVMEKCTYCVQRIETVRVVAERQNRRIRDGEITPACAQACPSQALVFGDIRDKNSRVAKLMKQDRMYGILNKELYTKPRTRYLPKVWNPNPALPEEPLSPKGLM